MGDCKNNLEAKTEKGKKLLDRVFKKDSKKEPEHTAETFTDTLADLDESLEKLISIKEKDLKSEKGSESENTLKLAKLKTMQFYIDSIVQQIKEYSEL